MREEIIKRTGERSLRVVVEEPEICDWWNSGKPFEKSKCSAGCEGDKNKCSNNYYSPRKVNDSKNGKNDRTYSEPFPDYLL